MQSALQGAGIGQIQLLAFRGLGRSMLHDASASSTATAVEQQMARKGLSLDFTTPEGSISNEETVYGCLVRKAQTLSPDMTEGRIGGRRGGARCLLERTPFSCNAASSRTSTIAPGWGIKNFDP